MKALENKETIHIKLFIKGYQ